MPAAAPQTLIREGAEHRVAAHLMASKCNLDPQLSKGQEGHLTLCVM